MLWTELLGKSAIVCACAAAALVGALLFRKRRRFAEQTNDPDSDGKTGDELLSDLIRYDRLRRYERPIPVLVFVAVALFFAGALVLWISPSPQQRTLEGIDEEIRQLQGLIASQVAPPTVSQTTPEVKETITLQWSVGSLLLALLLGGAGTALLFAQPKSAKVAGGALMTVGTATLAGHLIGKVENLIKLDKPALNFISDTVIQNGGGMGPELVASFSGFDLGDSSFDPYTLPARGSIPQLLCASAGDHDRQRWSESFKGLRESWIEKRKNGKTAIFLLVGATDRLALSGPVRSRYEANSGLATARAEAVNPAFWRLFEIWAPNFSWTKVGWLSLFRDRSERRLRRSRTVLVQPGSATRKTAA